MINPPELRTLRDFIEREKRTAVAVLTEHGIEGSPWLEQCDQALFALDTITHLIRGLQEPTK